MKNEYYERFAIHILSDLAERRDEDGAVMQRGERRTRVADGEQRRVPLRGESVCYVGVEPGRGSDSSLRLTMAVTAFEKAYQETHRRSRGGNWDGCVRTAELILEGDRKGWQPYKRLRLRFLVGKRGAKRPSGKVSRKQRKKQIPRPRTVVRPTEEGRERFRELDALIAAGGQSSTRQQTSVAPGVFRLAKIVRSQVERFRRKHSDWRRSFDLRFSAFRYDHCRDDQWYREQELIYRSRLHSAEAGSFMNTIAIEAANLAVLCHEQGKYPEAQAIYLKARDAWAVATTAGDVRRGIALKWIDVQIANCIEHNLPEPRPGYRLPQTEGSTFNLQLRLNPAAREMPHVTSRVVSPSNVSPHTN